MLLGRSHSNSWVGGNQGRRPASQFALGCGWGYKNHLESPGWPSPPPVQRGAGQSQPYFFSGASSMLEGCPKTHEGMNFGSGRQARSADKSSQSWKMRSLTMKAAVILALVSGSFAVRPCCGRPISCRLHNLLHHIAAQVPIINPELEETGGSYCISAFTCS